MIRTGYAAVVAACVLSAAGPAGAGTVRMPVDSVGYATTPAETRLLVDELQRCEYDRLAANEKADRRIGSRAMIGAIAPHDDDLYAGPGYIHAMRGIRAPLVVLVGVSHAARRQGIEEKIVFDDFDAWRGPFGDTPVSDLRARLIEALPPEMVLVSGEMHAAEHSLEAFIPFLQYTEYDTGECRFSERYRRPAPAILPILVTRFPGEQMPRAAALVAGLLRALLDERGLVLGRDVVVLVSADCVHYGDEGWGGRNYAPFGTDRAGYERGVAQDLDIIRSSLVGPIDAGSVSAFRGRIERDDLEWPYRVTWCGVYSIPFGLTLLAELARLEGRGAPEGVMLRYGTSLESADAGLAVAGLGTTAVATLRHWVGYAAIGYW